MQTNNTYRPFNSNSSGYKPRPQGSSFGYNRINTGSTYKPGFRKPYVRQENTYGLKKDDMITAPMVIVIGFEGENLGEMTSFDALTLAKEQELSLVEVAPTAKPPVCKIVDWEKFRYELKKKANAPKGASKNDTKVHGLWFTPHIGPGDYQYRIDKIKGWISENHPVKIEIRGQRGRIPQDLFFTLMARIKEDLKEFVKFDSTPKMEGPKRMNLMVSPLKK